MDFKKIIAIFAMLFKKKDNIVVKPSEKAIKLSKKFEEATGRTPKVWKVGDMLSPHFSYDEMTRSQTAERNSIDNTPKMEQVDSLIALCENILEPVRKHFKKPVTVTSGFRCIELNRKIGSTDKSQHTKGEAADFVVNGGATVTDVWRWIIDSDLDFDQVIQEFGRWVHVSYKKEGKNRHKCSVARKIDGKTRYFHYTEDRIASGDYEL